MHGFDTFRARTRLERGREREAVGAGAGSGGKLAEATEGVTGEAMGDVGGDHGVEGDGVLVGGLVEGEDRGREVVEARVEVDELRGEEDVACEVRDDDERVEGFRGAERAAGSEKAVEDVHGHQEAAAAAAEEEAQICIGQNENENVERARQQRLEMGILGLD